MTSRDDLAAGTIAAKNSDNLAIIRARAEIFAKTMANEKPTNLEVGYSAVFLSLLEAANQVRVCADGDLAVEQMRELADRLDALAVDTITLGEAHTKGGGR